MTDTDFEALIAELAPVRKRHSVYAGAKYVTYYETVEDAEAEVARLTSNGYNDVRIFTTNI